MVQQAQRRVFLKGAKGTIRDCWSRLSIHVDHTLERADPDGLRTPAPLRWAVRPELPGTAGRLRGIIYRPLSITCQLIDERDRVNGPLSFVGVVCAFRGGVNSLLIQDRARDCRGHSSTHGAADPPGARRNEWILVIFTGTTNIADAVARIALPLLAAQDRVDHPSWSPRSRPS